MRLVPVAPPPPASPVTEPQDAVLGILRLARALDSVDSGLSPQQYRILKLAGAGGERSARLAERLAVAKPTLTAIADSLVAAGLARREAEAGDRRVVRLHLTEAGLAAVERADAAYGQWLETILELSGNGDQIQADLRLMVGALEELRRRKKAAAARTRTGETTSTASTASPAPTATTAPDPAPPDTAAPDTAAPHTAASAPSLQASPARAGRP
ncbi:MAG TPA: MarR family transcriptional regulator [Streptosporangiaceae bacterium]